MKETKVRLLTVEELALDAFQKQEYLNALSMMNTPNDYDERKKAFIQYALAQKNASEAQSKLNQAIKS